MSIFKKGLALFFIIFSLNSWSQLRIKVPSVDYSVSCSQRWSSLNTELDDYKGTLDKSWSDVEREPTAAKETVKFGHFQRLSREHVNIECISRGHISDYDLNEMDKRIEKYNKEDACLSAYALSVTPRELAKAELRKPVPDRKALPQNWLDRMISVESSLKIYQVQLYRLTASNTPCAHDDKIMQAIRHNLTSTTDYLEQYGRAIGDWKAGKTPQEPKPLNQANGSSGPVPIFRDVPKASMDETVEDKTARLERQRESEIKAKEEELKSKTEACKTKWDTNLKNIQDAGSVQKKTLAILESAPEAALALSPIPSFSKMDDTCIGLLKISPNDVRKKEQEHKDLEASQNCLQDHLFAGLDLRAINSSIGHWKKNGDSSSYVELQIQMNNYLGKLEKLVSNFNATCSNLPKLLVLDNAQIKKMKDQSRYYKSLNYSQNQMRAEDLMKVMFPGKNIPKVNCTDNSYAFTSDLDDILAAARKQMTPKMVLESMGESAKRLSKYAKNDLKIRTEGCTWYFTQQNCPPSPDCGHLMTKVDLSEFEIGHFGRDLDFTPQLKEMDDFLQDSSYRRRDQPLLYIKPNSGHFQVQFVPTKSYERPPKPRDTPSLDVPFENILARDQFYADMVQASIACRPKMFDPVAYNPGPESESRESQLEKVIEKALKDTRIERDGIIIEAELMDLNCRPMFAEKVCPIGQQCPYTNYTSVSPADVDFNRKKETKADGLYELTLVNASGKGFKKLIPGPPRVESEGPFTLKFTNPESRKKFLDAFEEKMRSCK